MEDFEELETNYQKELERIDKEFLEKAKDNKNKQEREKSYLAKLGAIKKNYEKACERSINKEKKRIQRLKNKVLRKEKDSNKVFKAESINLKEGGWDRLKIKLEIFKFRSSIKINKALRAMTPQSVIVFRVKLRLRLKRDLAIFKEKSKKGYSQIKSYIAETASNLWALIQGFFAYLKKISVGLIKKISLKVRTKKSLEEKNEKSEDQKIAERLLQKKDTKEKSQ